MTRSISPSLLALASICGFAASAEAAIIRVNAASPVLGDGSSWNQAMPHLRDALAAAQAGDEIWVAQGVYRPDQSGATPEGTGDRAASFQMKSGVAIFGGFVGTETARSQRAWNSYPTILSGDIGVQSVHSDNAYNVVQAAGVNTLAVLDGFTITRGQADGVTTIDTYVGGGVYISAGARPTIGNCRFEDNWARGGAAISSQGASAVITNCVFLRGYGATRSGGVEFTASANAVVTDCRFEDNTAYFGGGLYINEGSAGGLVERCTFVNNASVNGGAIFLAGFSTTTVRDSLFLKNECRQLGPYQTSFDGGAVENWCTASVFINCLFNGNRATGAGGAICDGGPSGSNSTLVNCTIYGNWSRDGGAVGAIMGHTPSVKNSIVWGNTASAGDPSISPGVVATASNVQGFSSADASNLNLDPQFVAPNGNDGMPATPDDNFALLSTSPLIDAGDNALVPPSTPTDYLGNARIIDGNADNAAVVDMGALEAVPLPPPPCIGDANGDRVVNFADITSVLTNWGGPGPAGDSDTSGVVNFADITSTLTSWGDECPI
jgi:hypothetical protein